MESELYFEARTYDIDFAGIVSNIVYHRWLEDLRLACLAQVMPVPDMIRQGLVPTLAQVLIDFRAPVRLGQRVRGRQALVKTGRTSMVFESELILADEEHVAAVSRSVLVLVDTSDGRPTVLPEALREAARTPPSFRISIRGVDA